MPNKVRLHNRDDGTIVGIDENGNEVPVEFAEGEFQTLHAGELGIGDGEPVSAGPIGDTGDYIPLTSTTLTGVDVRFENTYDTGITASYTQSLTYKATDDQLPTNVEGYAVGWSCLMSNDTEGEESIVYLRDHAGSDITDAEISMEGAGERTLSSPIVPYNPDSTVRIGTRGRVTGGEGRMRSISFQVFGLL